MLTEYIPSKGITDWFYSSGNTGSGGGANTASAGSAVAPSVPKPPAAQSAPMTPQPGDVDPVTGNRWSPQYGWLPPNFFSDLNPPTGMEGQGGNTGGVASLPATLAAQAGPLPSGGIPVIPAGGGSAPYFEIPDAFLQYLTPQQRAEFNNYLRAIGMSGTGNVGQYGERTYITPGGANTYPFSLENLMAMVQNPRLQSLIRWFLGERGVSGFERVPFPQAT